MTLITPSGEEGDDRTLMDAAERTLARAIERFEDMVTRFEADVQDTEDPVTLSKLKGGAAEVNDAVRALFKERHKLDGQIYGKGGAPLAEPVDFEGARAEIGGLLDRIRHAGAQGGVSE